MLFFFFHSQYGILIYLCSPLLADVRVDFSVWLLQTMSCKCILVSMCVGSSRAPTRGVELLGHKVCTSSALPGNTRLFPRWLYQFILPPEAQKSSSCSTSSITLCLVCGVIYLFILQYSQCIFLIISFHPFSLDTGSSPHFITYIN